MKSILLEPRKVTTVKNVVVLGSGRSGTSMVTGTLAGKGFYMGSGLYRPSVTNPKGYFESWDINGINEDLLAMVIPPRPRILGKWFFRKRPQLGQRWLARVPLGTTIPCSSQIVERIKRVVQNQPFCIKDPRFSYTLPVWRPFLKNVVFLCVFRSPVSTVSSMVKARTVMPYLRSLSIDDKLALEVWSLMYRHILDIHRHEGDWLFLHYDQVLGGEGLDRIEKFVGAKVNRDFPDPALKRSVPRKTISKEARKIYEKLCALAGYAEE